MNKKQIWVLSIIGLSLVIGLTIWKIFPEKTTNPTPETHPIALPEEVPVAPEPKADPTKPQIPDPQELLQKLSDNILNLTAFSVDVKITLEVKSPDLDDTTINDYTISVKRPNTYAQKLHKQETGISLASDGEQLRIYSGPSNQQLIIEAPSSIADIFSEGGPGEVFGGGDDALFYWMISDDPYADLTENNEVLRYIDTESLNDESTYHLEIGDGELSMDLWLLEESSLLPKKMFMDMSTALMGEGNLLASAKDAYAHLIVEFSNWNTSPTFSTSTFALNVPSDTDTVEIDNINELIADTGIGEENAPFPIEDIESEALSLTGKKAPPFKLPLLKGETASIKPSSTGKPILLNFWATWCESCQEALPTLQSLSDQYSDSEILFYSINIGESKEQIEKFFEVKSLSLTTLLDSDYSVARKYKVESIPQVVIIDSQGIIQNVKIGISSSWKEEVETQIKKVLEESKNA